jgi:hypothetical protein
MNNTTSSPSNGYNLVQAAIQPVIYSYSVTTTFIVITSILNVCVLSRRALRSSPCTHYFHAAVPPIFVFLIVAPVSMIFQNRYGFYLMGTPVICKMSIYLIITTSLLYGLMLVCASVDRFCSSSTSVRLRQLSHVRVARRVIIIVWILALTCMSPLMIIYYYDYNSQKCTVYSSTALITVYLIARVVVFYFVIPIILGIFGSLTIYNIRHQTNRVAPVNQTNAHRRTKVNWLEC